MAWASEPRRHGLPPPVPINSYERALSSFGSVSSSRAEAPEQAQLATCRMCDTWELRLRTQSMRDVDFQAGPEETEDRSKGTRSGLETLK
jgi:hypothetical protein